MAAGAVLSLALLAAMTFGGGKAYATNPGLNGKLGCEGVRGPAVPNPNPAGINRNEIVTFDPSGANESVLTDNLVRDGDPSFSPDGKFIAFEGFQSGSSEAYRMKTDGTEVTRLTFNGTNADGTSREDRGTNWSPDGKKIVFHSTRDRATIPAPGSPFEIYTMNADGSNQTRLTNNTVQDSLAAWSPDGQKIAFLSFRDNDFELYKMNPDGTNVERLTNSPGEDSQPTWSPDGKQIGFHSRRDNPPAPAPQSNVDIYKMNADGSNPTRLTTTPSVAEIFPVWSPDGTRIAFDTFADVFTINASDGGNQQQVTTTSTIESRCDWQSIPRPRAVPPLVYPRPNYPVPTASFAGCPSATTNQIFGNAGPNTLNGTPAGDRIFGGAGDDVVDALAGSDCVDLGSGADRGQGGSGNDILLGGLGRDRISGSSGNDRIRGNGDGDNLGGGSGNDVLNGVSGNDRISGSQGRDRLNGGSGRDAISAGSSNDRVAGDQGNDRVNGDSGNDSINGSSGNDRLSGGSGRDRLSGGSGNDRISARDRRRDRISCGSGRRDSVSADRIDRVARDCERVRRR